VKGALGRLCLTVLPAKSLSQGGHTAWCFRLLLTQVQLWILDELRTAFDQAAMQLAPFLFGAHLRKGGIVMPTACQPVSIMGIDPKTLQLSPILKMRNTAKKNLKRKQLQFPCI